MKKKKQVKKKEAPKTHEDHYHVSMLIKHTKLAITNEESDINDYFKNQLKILENRLKAIK